jgi:deoxycytidylate deaminase
MGSEVRPGSDYNLFPCYAIHAEHNAILQAGLAACVGATIYVTDEPCQQCLNLIEHAKIGRVVVTPEEMIEAAIAQQEAIASAAEAAQLLAVSEAEQILREDGSQ